MKLKAIKCANAVKVGQRLEHFFPENDFEITLTQGVIVTITEKRSGAVKCTSLFNVIEWEPSQAEEKQSPVTEKGGKRVA